MNTKLYIWEKEAWPEFTWDDSKILNHLSLARRAQGKLLAQAAEVGIEIQAQILAEDAQKTSAIEGEKLDLDSIRSSVARRLGLSTAGLPSEQRHIEGLIEMLLDASENYKQPISARRLKGWQASLFPTGFSGLHKIKVGDWRDSEEPMQVISGKIGKEKIHYEAPPAKKISNEMKHFIDWFNSKKKLDGLIRAAIAHFWFVTIHPFEDGNGRIARAITDLALTQDEAFPKRCYSLSSQINLDRKDYYHVLEKTQKGDLDITDWIIWFLKTFIKALEKSEVTIKQAILIGEFWKTHAHVDLNPRQKKVLQKMLESDRLGLSGGMTNRKYVSLAKTSRETAKRDLGDLEEKNLIKRNKSKGRSISYSLILK